MTKYSNTPTNKVLEMALDKNAEACMELSARYQEGTCGVNKDQKMSDYWRKKAEELGYKSKSSNSSVLSTTALMALAEEGDFEACYQLAQRFAGDSDREIYWLDRAKKLQTGEYWEDEKVEMKLDIDLKEKNYDWAIKPDKNRHQYVIGIDLGHGETSAAFCPIDWDTAARELEGVKDLDFGSNCKVIPSAINVTENGKAYIGELAFSPDILNKANVNVCFKQKPVDMNGEKEQLMIRYMKEVYQIIREKNPGLFTDDNHLVYIATPSGWNDATKDLYGQMATQAGLPMAGITSESRAAFIRAQQDASSGLPQYIDKGAIVFDMGSSTLDFTYLSDGIKPIDYGYDCGASQVEKIIYKNIRAKNEDIISFEKKYFNLIDFLLFDARKAKEKVYFSPDLPYRKTINFEDFIPDDEDFEDAKIRFKFQPNELNQMLEDAGYINAIRQAMIDFKNTHIGEMPIHVAFLTGGASRMDFIKPLVQECWGLPKERIYQDQDPSLTISRGVAEVARGDIRSGGIGNAQKLLKELSADTNIYVPFSNALIEKVTDEITSTMASCITNFRDNDTDVSINDLQSYISDNIDNNINQIGDWAMECYKEAFENKTAEIREKLDKIVSNYSRDNVQLRRANVSISSMPNIDLSMLNSQMQEIGASFMEDSSNLVQGIAGAAIGGAVAMLLGGPLAWLVGGGYLIGKFFFGEKKSEAQKREEAMAKDLDRDARLKVYNEFEANWNTICGKVHNSVTQSIHGNHQLRQIINNQSQKVIEDYIKECIKQTRLMVE